MRICQNCGTEVSDTARFCRKCGTALNFESDIQETAAEPAVEPMETAGYTDMDTAGYAEEGTPGHEAQETPAFEGDSFEWGPPTGAPEDYDQQPMPPVYVGGAEQAQSDEDEKAGAYTYTYRDEIPAWDHTEEFDEDDIADNKVVAMAPYLLGVMGVIIALLAGQNSPYAAFHMRQGLKFLIIDALLVIIALVLCWTLIIPAACAVVEIILAVIKIVCFVSVCKGRAVEPAIIRSLGFLR